MLGDAGALPESDIRTLMIADHTAFQVRSSVLSRERIGQSSWEGLDMGCHKKAPLCCSCSQ